MRISDIRSTFLEFFSQRGHTVVPSSHVVPHDDPTLLFANAGMNQFKSVFTGVEGRDYKRAATSQKCIRAGGKHNDLENVGQTARHLTFFEMLGNFSFGDYFKSEACRWAWELVTEEFRIDPEKLLITVFREDDEARRVWHEEVGIPQERIIGLGEKDNYWSMGDVGPCGPCSEIHFDQGVAVACGPKCAIGVCDCDRFVEIWNLVFMQYDQLPGGKKVALPRPSIDTGMGLERIAMILQGKKSVYETDLLKVLIDKVTELTGVAYDEGPEGIGHRVIADHLRSLSFAIADGAYPSNEDRGYVLRRILRRASRYGYKLGREEPFIFDLVQVLAEAMGEAYPELREQQALTERLVRKEEEQFGKTLRTGMARFNEEVEDLRTRGQKVFTAQAAFFLHDSCGFPIDLTEQMTREIDCTVDRGGFEELMNEQRERARASGAARTGGHGRAPTAEFEDLEPTRFTGYHDFHGTGRILAAEGGEEMLQLVTDTSPFFGEAGGQVGDTGTICGDRFELKVTDTQRTARGVFVHHGHLIEGSRDAIRIGMGVEVDVDADRRMSIQRNHTATHLLHAALRSVLGTHVQQKGSLVAPDRLRFDLSHYERIQSEQLIEVEKVVQLKILEDQELEIGEYEKDEALARGAMAFFGEKYGDRVRVVEIPGFSLELCGGAHVRRTGEIGGFLLVSEESAAAGVRRLEAITGREALQRSRANEDLVQRLSELLKASRTELSERVTGLIAENRKLRSGQGAASQTDRLKELDGGGADRESIEGHEVISSSWDETPVEELLRVADALKRRPGKRVFILATRDESGARFVIGTSREVPKGSLHCGKIAGGGAKILGGGGGGRPDLAQAGGKETARLGEAMTWMRQAVAEALKK